MILDFPVEIPTWDSGEYKTTTFNTRDEYKDFVLHCFKEPGQYNFNQDSSDVFTEQALLFNKQGFYCIYPENTKDFINYWEDQKAKCRYGLIVKSGSNQWYMTRDYYMWLNFLPIFNKETQKFGFAIVTGKPYLHLAF